MQKLLLIPLFLFTISNSQFLRSKGIDLDLEMNNFNSLLFNECDNEPSQGVIQVQAIETLPNNNPKGADFYLRAKVKAIKVVLITDERISVPTNNISGGRSIHSTINIFKSQKLDLKQGDEADFDFRIAANPPSFGGKDTLTARLNFVHRKPDDGLYSGETLECIQFDIKMIK